MSFLNTQSQDFISLSQEGLSILALNDKLQSKHLMDNKGRRHLIHSLASCNYLKIDKQNHILFECASEEKVLNVQSQYKSRNEQTQFEDIFKIQISNLNIKELLMLQSVFHCETSNDVLKLVEMQGNPQIFYSAYLELERRNMVSILAFDSMSIKSLLSESFEEFFTSEFPIFYKNKKLWVKKGKDGKLRNCYKIYTAIDVALENNQIRAVGIMIEHIVKYQNNFVSSFLFRKNLIPLMMKGIETANLLGSNIF